MKFKLISVKYSSIGQVTPRLSEIYDRLSTILNEMGLVDFMLDNIDHFDVNIETIPKSEKGFPGIWNKLNVEGQTTLLKFASEYMANHKEMQFIIMSLSPEFLTTPPAKSEQEVGGLLNIVNASKTAPVSRTPDLLAGEILVRIGGRSYPLDAIDHAITNIDDTALFRIIKSPNMLSTSSTGISSQASGLGEIRFVTALQSLYKSRLSYHQLREGRQDNISFPDTFKSNLTRLKALQLLLPETDELSDELDSGGWYLNHMKDISSLNTETF
jgi:hypothetical protein